MRMAIVSLAILVCLTPSLLAQTESVRPSVSVVGEADMKVSPDQVVFTLEIVSNDKDLAVAKQANDAAAAKTLVAVKAFNIPSDDVQTDSLTMAPKYSTTFHTLVGYEVTKRILVTYKDLSKIDAFVTRVIDAGVNRIIDVSIENSQMQSHQEEVRAMAVKNAHDKAASYARQLGQTVGKAWVIREENGDYPTNFVQGFGSGNGNGSGSGDIAATDESPVTPPGLSREITFALGKIKIEEKIYVIFELNRQ